MNREEQILKYLDNELTEREVGEMKELLATDPEAQSILEAVREKRRQALAALSMLDPVEAHKVPEFDPREKSGFGVSGILRIAAAIVILVGVALALWLAGDTGHDQKADEMIAVSQEPDDQYDELDFLISPNRCWNERKLPIVIIEIK